MFSFQKLRDDSDLLSSSLLGQDSFYVTFAKDLTRAIHEVVIESPFTSFRRLNYLLPIFRELTQRKVRIVINTKLSEEQADYGIQAKGCIAILQQLGVEVLIAGGHHRKIAIIDRQILYE